MSGRANTEAALRSAGVPRGLIQRTDARVRVVVAAAFAFAVVSLDDLRVLFAAFAISFLFAVLARVPGKWTLRRMLGMDAFMVPILVLLPFTVAGEQVAAVGPWPVSAEGLRQAAAIVITANAVVLAVLALIGSMEPAHFGSVLRALGVPAKIAHLLALMTRYVGVFEGEYARLRLAMKARAFRAKGNLHTWRSLGYLFGMLLVRSFERGERIADAMKCRGFTGRFTAAERAPLAAADWAFAAGAMLATGGLVSAGILA